MSDSNDFMNDRSVDSEFFLTDLFDQDDIPTENDDSESNDSVIDDGSFSLLSTESTIMDVSSWFLLW